MKKGGLLLSRIVLRTINVGNLATATPSSVFHLSKPVLYIRKQDKLSAVKQLDKNKNNIPQRWKTHREILEMANPNLGNS